MRSYKIGSDYLKLLLKHMNDTFSKTEISTYYVKKRSNAICYTEKFRLFSGFFYCKTEHSYFLH